MSDPSTLPALDDVVDADRYAGDPVGAEHDLNPADFTEEADGE